MEAGISDRKRIAKTFLKLCATGKVREAYERHVAPDLIHHNPYFPGDAAALRRGMEQAATQFPKTTIEPQHVFEDKNLVAVHSKVQHEPGGRAIAVVHILRFRGERIAELWDIAAEEPADSPNENGMF